MEQSEEKQKPDSNVKSTTEAVTALIKAVPIYQDVVQPSAKQLGKDLEAITKTVSIALLPIKALVGGYEQMEQFLKTRVAEKLRNVKEENIVTPRIEVAGPAIEGNFEDMMKISESFLLIYWQQQWTRIL